MRKKIKNQKGGERKFGAGKKSVKDEEFANMSSLDRNRLLGISRGGGRSGDYAGVRVGREQPQKRKKFLGIFKDGGVKKYATAGMYDANVIPGSMNSTANIVGAERDASVLATNQAGMQSVTDKLKADNEVLASEINTIESTEDANIQAASDKVGKGAEATMGTIGKGLKSEKGQGILKNIFGKATPPKISGSLANAGSTAVGTPFVGAPTSQLLGATPGITAPSALSSGLSVPTIGGGVGGGGAFGGASLGSNSLAANLGSGALTNAASTAGKFAGFGKQGMEFANLAAKGTQGAKMAAGAGKFLTSGAGLGTVATLAGKGISKLSDDDNAAKSNTGEYAGSILSAAGTGASFGSVIPGIGTAVGAAAGAVYGAGKQYFGTKAAQKEKARIDQSKKIKIGEYNEQLEDQMGSQLSRARAGEMEQKTYSGYDLGKNVTYKLGGGKKMRRTPRYGN